MPTKEFGPTKIAWPHMWLKSAMVEEDKVIERYSASDQETVSIAADAKTPSHERSSRAAARLEAASRDCVKRAAPRRPPKKL